MNPVHAELRALLAQGLSVALATVVAVKGSTPREVGARMIVHPYGKHSGTVGGGCGEAEVIRAGLDVIAEGEARLVTIDLTEPLTRSAVGVCGGILHVYVERWQPGPEEQALLDALAAVQAARAPATLVTVIEGPPGLRGRRLLYGAAGELPAGDAVGLPAAAIAAAQAQGETALIEAGGLRLYVEAQLPPPHLIICGAGHIAAPLAAMAALCDFAVTVIDDRAQYATPARFPAATVIVGDFRRELAALRGPQGRFAPRTCLALITRGHQHDIDCLLEVIDDPLAYVGMIGSRRRIRAVFELLAREEGIDPARLAHVHAPIGLPIGAQTPAEIAVSILAELIASVRTTA